MHTTVRLHRFTIQELLGINQDCGRVVRLGTVEDGQGRHGRGQEESGHDIADFVESFIEERDALRTLGGQHVEQESWLVLVVFVVMNDLSTE
jgi:hypothetical protein